MSDEAVYRTAPATPGLLIISSLLISINDISSDVVWNYEFYK